MLAARGFQAVTCRTVEDALTLIGSTGPAFVIVDVFLPGMGGVAGLGAIKGRWPELPCIAVSAGWGGMDADMSLEAMRRTGVDAILKKPITGADLERVLGELGFAEPI
jgi:DNA-binding NtrC family response regulator